MIKLSLPGFYSHFKASQAFLDYYFNYREQFYNDRIIDSFYGIGDPLIWGGGRIITPTTEYTMVDIVNYFNLHPHIKLRHVFTNCLITECMLDDFLSNKYVREYIRPQDEVILNHPLLIQYFKNKYPNIPIIYSTTLNIKDISEVNNITKTNLYVLNYNYNNDQEYINKLQHKEHIEIICAEPCVPNCPRRMDHYRYISKDYLRMFKDVEPNEFYACPFGVEHRLPAEILLLPHAITNERIKELESQGIQYFKISGRNRNLPNWLETILYYTALPEYRDYIRQIFLAQWW